MKNLVILLVLHMCCGALVFAQERKAVQELLMSTNWEPQDFLHEGGSGYVRYTGIAFMVKMRIDDELRSSSYGYYLSLSPDSVFYTGKVGRNKHGKYLIEVGGSYVFISEILELSAGRLVVRNLTSGVTITGKKTVCMPTKMIF